MPSSYVWRQTFPFAFRALFCNTLRYERKKRRSRRTSAQVAMRLSTMPMRSWNLQLQAVAIFSCRAEQQREFRPQRTEARSGEVCWPESHTIEEGVGVWPWFSNVKDILPPVYLPTDRLDGFRASPCCREHYLRSFSWSFRLGALGLEDKTQVMLIYDANKWG